MFGEKENLGKRRKKSDEDEGGEERKGERRETLANDVDKALTFCDITIEFFLLRHKRDRIGYMDGKQTRRFRASVSTYETIE